MEADFRLSRHAEFDLGQDEVVAIARLLHASFEDYPVDKIYFPQPPHVRVLGWEKNQLVGHVAGVIREVLVGDHHMVILGIADLCVEADRLRQKIATVLVQQLEAIADKRGISFLVALSGEKAFFQEIGFQELDAKCTWLAYLSGKSLGLCRRPLHGEVMVKRVHDRSWPPGDIDFLGPMF